MDNKNTFTETQKFRQWWLWALLLAIAGLFGYGLYQQLYLGIPWGTNPASDTALLVTGLVPIGLIVLFLTLRLDTHIDETGISYRFFPFQRRFKTIAWSEIEQAYIRQYNPIVDYGGWGLRLGLFGKGRAYNVKGNQGLQIVFKNGKKFLIGTQQPEALERVIHQFGNDK